MMDLKKQNDAMPPKGCIASSVAKAEGGFATHPSGPMAQGELRDPQSSTTVQILESIKVNAYEEGIINLHIEVPSLVASREEAIESTSKGFTRITLNIDSTTLKFDVVADVFVDGRYMFSGCATPGLPTICPVLKH